MSMWKNIRSGAGLTQEEMANKLNVSRQMINNYENGRYKLSIKAQIEYLKLRNNEDDQKLIKYLEGMI